MRCKLKPVFLGLILSLVMAPSVWALPLSEYNKLKDVTVERVEGELHIQVHFKKAPANHTPPVFFKKSIQVDFPNTYLAPAKQYFPTSDSEIKQVYASQYDSEKLRVRFILGERDRNLVDRFHMQRIGNILDIRVKPVAPISSTTKKTQVVTQTKKKSGNPLDGLFDRANQIQKEKEQALEPKIKPEKHAESLLQLFDDPKQTESSKVEETIVSKSKSTELSKAVGSAFQKKSSTSLSEVLGGNKKEAEAVPPTQTPFGEAKSPDLVSTGFKMFSMLVLVLGVMFLVFYLFKKFVWKNSVFGSGSKPIKVLSTGFLGPKKSIALVEVAGEVLVLGISNDNISLLGNVEEPGRIDLIKGMEEGATRGTAVAAPFKKKKRVDGSLSTPASSPKTESGKVDAYTSIRKKKEAAKPFPEMVENFNEPQEDAVPSMDELSERLNQNLRTTGPTV